MGEDSSKRLPQAKLLMELYIRRLSEEDSVVGTTDYAFNTIPMFFITMWIILVTGRPPMPVIEYMELTQYLEVDVNAA